MMNNFKISIFFFKFQVLVKVLVKDNYKLKLQAGRHLDKYEDEKLMFTVIYLQIHIEYC